VGTGTFVSQMGWGRVECMWEPVGIGTELSKVSGVPWPAFRDHLISQAHQR